MTLNGGTLKHEAYFPKMQQHSLLEIYIIWFCHSVWKRWQIHWQVVTSWEENETVLQTFWTTEIDIELLNGLLCMSCASYIIVPTVFRNIVSFFHELLFRIFHVYARYCPTDAKKRLSSYIYDIDFFFLGKIIPTWKFCKIQSQGYTKIHIVARRMLIC